MCILAITMRIVSVCVEWCCMSSVRTIQMCTRYITAMLTIHSHSGKNKWSRVEEWTSAEKVCAMKRECMIEKCYKLSEWICILPKRYSTLYELRSLLFVHLVLCVLTQHIHGIHIIFAIYFVNLLIFCILFVCFKYFFSSIGSHFLLYFGCLSPRKRVLFFHSHSCCLFSLLIFAEVCML